MSLRRRTVHGVLWNVGQRGLATGISFLVTLVLARLLAPADFGVLAMMAVFLAVAGSLMDSGLSQALIRLRDPAAADYSTAFIANLALGLLAYALIFLVAPLVAKFYSEPRLMVMLRIAALVVPINALSAVQVAMLARNLDFKRQLTVTIPSQLASGAVAIVLAIAGFGAWALIVQILIAAMLTGIRYWQTSSWRPSGGFDKTSFGRLYNFGSKLWASGLIDTVFNNLYVIVIAKVFTPAVAGHYFFANKIKSLLLNQVVGSIGSVTYPTLASIQHDDQKLRAGYRKIVQVTTFLLFPMLLITAALAADLFTVFLPQRWAPAVLYLQLLCLAGLLYPLHTLNLNILKVKGRSDLFLGLEVIKKTLMVVVLLVTIPYGVVAILLGQIVQSAFTYLPNSWYSRRLIGYGLWSQLKDSLPQLVLALVAAMGAYWIPPYLSDVPWLRLVWGAGLGFMIFVLGALFTKLPALTESLSILRERGAP